MNSVWTGRLQRLIWWGVLAVVIGLPFHVLIYSLLHRHAPGLSGPFRNWKEALTLVLDLAALAAIAGRRAFSELRGRADLWLIAAFVLLHLIFMAFTKDTSAAVLATKVNVIFLLLYAAATFCRPLSERGRHLLLWALLLPAAAAGLFGLLQLTILPHEFLTRLGFGFGSGQISPYEFIQNSTILRVQSFMFGPNQYGSYLGLPIILAAWVAATRRTVWTRCAAGLLAILLLINLYGTQSRGSWIGVLGGLVVLAWLLLKRRGRIILACAFIAAAAAFAVSLPRLSQTHWSFIFRHNTPGSVSAPDATDVLHYQRLKEGLSIFSKHPFGEGLTAAGRASDLTGQSFYTENFYLQIADQVGIEGLVLFLLIITFVAWQLLRLGGLGVPLLAALAAISVMNLFSHTWSDGATAMLWWGSAGLALAGRNHVRQS